MKKIIAILAIMICMAGAASTAFAKGYGHHGGRHHGGYHHRSHGGGHHYGGHRHGGRHHDDLDIAFGIAGGLLLGSVLVRSLEPPPPRVVYAPANPVYQPPRTCVEERTVSGEWQVNRYDGSQVWVQYKYPLIKRYQVPCY